MVVIISYMYVCMLCMYEDTCVVVMYVCIYVCMYMILNLVK